MTETNEGSSPGQGRPQGRQRHGPMSGRQAEAARNDQRILDSARAVFVADPGAPITAVAKHAGVGISALYTRYGSKEELLRTLCTDGLLIVVSARPRPPSSASKRATTTGRFSRTSCATWPTRTPAR